MTLWNRVTILCKGCGCWSNYFKAVLYGIHLSLKLWDGWVSTSLQWIWVFHESVVNIVLVLYYYGICLNCMIGVWLIYYNWNRAVVVWGVMSGPNWIPHLMNSKGRIITIGKVQKLLYRKIFGPPAIVIWKILPCSLAEASRLPAHLLRYMMLMVPDARARLLNL